jgi:hypothetical protein
MPPQPVRPAFEFREYGIAIHFVLQVEDGHKPGAPVDSERELKSGPNFESLERDLLSSVNRELRIVTSTGALRTLRLFGSLSLEPPPGCDVIELRYPARLEYSAEGKDRPVFPPDDDDFHGEWRPEELTDGERRRCFRFLPSLTEFRSGVAVLHLVFAPLADDPASIINEWDLIVLEKLWQGGEGVGPTDGENSLVQRVKFVPRGKSESFTVNELAQITLSGEHAPNTPRSYWERKTEDRLAFEPRAGTFELTADDAAGANMSGTYLRLKKLACAETGANDAPPHLVPVEGILCGLLDYFDIGSDELEDVFADPVMADDETFLDIHKGTMLMLASDIRRIEPLTGKPLGVNPYLLLPHSVLLHNEYWLRQAHLKASEVASSRRIRDLEKAELQIRAALQQHRLPNVFHYRTERRWYDDGHQARGLNDLQQVVEKQLQNINGVLDELRAANDRTDAYLIGVLGLTIAAMQVLGSITALEQLQQDGMHKHGYWLIAVGVPLAIGLAYITYKRYFK